MRSGSPATTTLGWHVLAAVLAFGLAAAGLEALRDSTLSYVPPEARPPFWGHEWVLANRVLVVLVIASLLAGGHLLARSAQQFYRWRQSCDR